MGVRDYNDALRRLSPKGWVERFGRYVSLLDGAADELGRLDDELASILDDADISTASAEALARWAVVYDCDATTAAVTAAARARGGQSAEYFISLCLAAGYTVTITTYSAFLCGVNSCGDLLSNGSWPYHWEVVGSAGAIPAWLQTVIQRLKPAHTTVSFS